MQTHLWPATGDRVAVVGQGTWDIELADRRAAIAALRRGLDLGMTHIDTAEMYGDGESEAIIGEAIAGRRDEVFLVSKVLPHNASRRGVVQACERSLARLGTDRLDCYLLHWRGRHPLAETVAGFEDLVRAGMIRSWGVSNFDVADLEALRAIGSDTVCACNQLLYHLGERAIEHAVLPWCEANGIPVVAYSPLQRGRIPRPESAGGRVLAEIAAAHGATVRQAILAFLTRRESLFAIPKAAHAAHVEDNAAAGELRLDEAEISRLDAAFPLGSPPKYLPML
jgi:diketogulonate reductase-like aldo/keto reductase